jgi:hypothetical protein
MSTLLLLARENPLPGLALASLNLMLALSLVTVSLSLCIAISLLAWVHAFADRSLPQVGRQVAQRKLA